MFTLYTKLFPNRLTAPTERVDLGQATARVIPAAAGDWTISTMGRERGRQALWSDGRSPSGISRAKCPARGARAQRPCTP